MIYSILTLSAVIVSLIAMNIGEIEYAILLMVGAVWVRTFQLEQRFEERE